MTNSTRTLNIVGVPEDDTMDGLNTNQSITSAV